MKFNEIQEKLVGDWSGDNLLRLSWLTPPDYFSAAEVLVARAAKGKFLTFRYTWSHDHVPQEGLLVLGYDEKQRLATASWVDSWHQSARVMFCSGTIDLTGRIDLRGSYEVSPGPDWGWRIVILQPADSQLQINMYNCSPEGEEELAVQAKYERKI